ncbi:hypothetical protein LUZ60_003428 [Juncus effusus]|nr:hypothetical protein LUZ60_003428 [Juncus effusus]
MEKEEESAIVAGAVELVVRKEVADWDDPVIAGARFKALSGQRADWEPLFLFWRDLILKVCRHLQISLVPSSQVKNVWFCKDGLTPLCIDQVLQEMHVNGDILLKNDLIDPTSGNLYQIIKKFGKLIGAFNSTKNNSEEILIITSVLEERISDVIKRLRDEGQNWNSACVITKNKFESFFKNREEADVALSFICQNNKARYFSLKERDFIEGVKVSVVKSSVESITKFDYYLLNLIWTEEKLNQQIDLINQNWQRSRQMALTCLKSGNKQAALRHIKQSKLISENREKFNSMHEKVENILQLISDAESAKNVSEAIKIGTMAIKEQSINIEEIYQNIEELNLVVSAQKQVNSALESSSIQSMDLEDEEIEEELRDLEVELLKDELPRIEIQEKQELQIPVLNDEKSVDSLSENLSSLILEPA